MRKHANILFSLFFLTFIICVFTTCRKEEIVIVYSKIQTVGTSSTTSMSTVVEGLIEELTEATHSEFGVCWSNSKDPTVYDNKSLASGVPSTGSYTVSLSGLDPATTYHTRAFVIDNKKYIYGADVSFITAAPNLPVVSTVDASSITSKYAVSGGNVTQAGDKPVIAKGVCYDTISSPTIQKNKTMDGSGTGAFTSYLNNLESSKKYYIRAYAISEFGISYGSEVTFTTNAKQYTFHEEFTDNLNEWDTGIETTWSAEITGGEYVIKYYNEGYLLLDYNNFPDILNFSNSKDFEINLSIQLQPYNDTLTNLSMSGGLLWDCDDSNFKYFGIKKVLGFVNRSQVGYIYSYTVGAYNGSYTIWKDYTTFTGTDFNKLTIKKGGGYYYFFINGVQVHKQSYTSITYDGIGFYLSNTTLHADYLYIDQKGEKKSIATDLIQMTPDSKGKKDFVRRLDNQ